jgi:23S rRNA pseudouridine1911/1915/1917 synthase
MTELYSLHRLTLNAPGALLFAALAEQLPGLSRHMARRTVMAGLVKLGGTTVLEAKTTLGPKPVACEVDLRHGFKSTLKARLHEGAASKEAAIKPFTVLYQDEHLLVVDKAAGVLSSTPRQEPGSKPVRGHLPELIRRMFRKQGREVRYIGVVHRLDQDTSGCICFALSREAHRMLGAQFAGEAAGRTYRALVQGGPRADCDTIAGTMTRGEGGKRRLTRAGPTTPEGDHDDEDTHGKSAVTHFQVVKRYAQGTDVEVNLETGRTHQIRVSMAAIACPVYGDRIYGFRPKAGQPLPPKAPRLMLHAWKLSLDHPATGKRMVIEAPMPPEFADFIKQIKEPAAALPPAFGDAPAPRRAARPAAFGDADTPRRPARPETFGEDAPRAPRKPGRPRR